MNMYIELNKTYWILLGHDNVTCYRDGQLCIFDNWNEARICQKWFKEYIKLNPKIKKVQLNLVSKVK